MCVFVKCIFTVVESCVNVSKIRVNVLNDMLTDDRVYCEFAVVQFQTTRSYTKFVMVLFLLDLERNDFVF